MSRLGVGVYVCIKRSFLSIVHFTIAYPNSNSQHMRNRLYFEFFARCLLHEFELVFENQNPFSGLGISYCFANPISSVFL